ncbi:outer membrane porin, OprD family [Oxalobacteraceae bacterium]|nr:outer membrane porin, OprD family [Oxalobacteraceae bacterium]
MDKKSLPLLALLLATGNLALAADDNSNASAAAAANDGASARIREESAPAPAYPLFSGSSLNFLLRSFASKQTVNGAFTRHAWTENLQVNFESGYTPGTLGFGVDISPFLAARINSTEKPGNLAHTGAPDDRAWAYLGKYALKAKLGESTVLKYGLQQTSNPVMESKDNRGLPPTYRGWTLASTLAPGVTAEAGSFDQMLGRGRSTLGPLSSNFGGVPVERLSYAGASWDYRDGANATLYLSQAREVWNQAYLSWTEQLGEAASVKWSSNASVYITRGQGRRLQGDIDGQAYSLSLKGTRGAFTGMVAFQQIASDYFHDFPGETWGNALSNALLVDYGAPHERSVQLRGVIDAAKLGVPGLRVMFWNISGWGANGGTNAARHSQPNDPLYELYWKNGRPLQGGHREFGIYPTYVLQEGKLKGSKLSFYAVAHRAATYYYDSGIREYKLALDIPWKAF